MPVSVESIVVFVAGSLLSAGLFRGFFAGWFFQRIGGFTERMSIVRLGMYVCTICVSLYLFFVCIYPEWLQNLIPVDTLRSLGEVKTVAVPVLGALRKILALIGRVFSWIHVLPVIVIIAAVFAAILCVRQSPDQAEEPFTRKHIFDYSEAGLENINRPAT